MSENLPIVCKATSWFKSRAVLMFLVFTGLGAWFYVDGNTGYRKKNEVYYLNENFRTAEEIFTQKTTGEDALDAEGWKAFVAKQKLEFPEDAEHILPRDLDLDQPWPEELADYETIQTNGNVVSVWEDYASRIGIGSEPGEKPYSKDDITEQFWMTGVCGVLSLATVFFGLRTLGREMVAGETTFSTPGKKPVEYDKITKLDKRKWNNKGLATVYYTEDGEEKKGRIDGFCYGGFKKEEDQPAEQYIAVVEKKMSGEILEYVDVDEDDDEEAGAPVIE